MLDQRINTPSARAIEDKEKEAPQYSTADSVPLRIGKNPSAIHISERRSDRRE